MLKYVLYAVLLLIVAGVVAGGVHLWRVAKRNKAEMSRYAESPREPLPDLGKVLVVYYSLSGNTRDIAARIQNSRHRNGSDGIRIGMDDAVGDSF